MNQVLSPSGPAEFVSAASQGLAVIRITAVIILFPKCLLMDVGWEGLWDLSHISMGADAEAQRRHAQHPHSSIPQGTLCVPERGRVRKAKVKAKKPPQQQQQRQKTLVAAKSETP